MRRRTVMTTVGFAVLVAGLLVNAPAEANAFEDGTTHLVLEFPVRVPGATLPAGRYVFTIDPTSHAAVWIRNEDDGLVYGPYLTRIRRRLESTSTRKIVVERSADANGIPTLRAWFGRYRDHGHELVYPRPSGD